jgi:hypothetical protein
LAAQEAWNLLGLLCRCSQSIGLHIDPNRWHLPPEDIQQRRSLFWETLTYDALQSLTHGRPTAFQVQSVDTKSPYGTDDDPVASSSSREADRSLQDVPRHAAFHAVKHRLAKVCTYMSCDTLVQRRQTHARTMEFDRELRSVEQSIPDFLRLDGNRGLAAGQTEEGGGGLGSMENLPWTESHLIAQRHMLAVLINKAYLFLHRPWLVLALRERPEEPLKSTFASSFATCIRSAQAIGRMMQSLVLCCPHIASVWWFFAFHGVGAAVTLAICIVKSPTSSLAFEAWQNFNLLVDTMRSLSTSKLASRNLPLLTRLGQRARAAMTAAASSSAATGPAGPSISSPLSNNNYNNIRAMDNQHPEPPPETDDQNDFDLLAVGDRVAVDKKAMINEAWKPSPLRRPCTLPLHSPAESQRSLPQESAAAVKRMPSAGKTANERRSAYAAQNSMYGLWTSTPSAGPSLSVDHNNNEPRQDALPASVVVAGLNCASASSSTLSPVEKDHTLSWDSSRFAPVDWEIFFSAPAPTRPGSRGLSEGAVNNHFNNNNSGGGEAASGGPWAGPDDWAVPSVHGEGWRGQASTIPFPQFMAGDPQLAESGMNIDPIMDVLLQDMDMDRRMDFSSL